MTGKPKVSIIVPNYNHAEFLGKRLDSIFGQSFINYEVILLDDCSTDGSLEILKGTEKHPSVQKFLINDKNSGSPYKQWYKGIKHAQGDIIWIAESDDWCDNKFLEYLVPIFDDKQISLAFAESKYIFSSEDEVISPPVNKYKFYEGTDFIRLKMMEGNGIVNASAVLFRKEIYLSVMDNGYTDFEFCGDWLLWMQLIQSHKVAYFPSTMNYLRRHCENASNILRSRGLDFIEGLKIFKIGKGMLNNEYDKNTVYKSWLNRFIRYKKHYNFAIVYKVISRLMLNEPGMGFYILFKYYKASIKRIISPPEIKCI